MEPVGVVKRCGVEYGMTPRRDLAENRTIVQGAAPHWRMQQKLEGPSSRSPTFDTPCSLCLAKPSHLRCELMLAPPLDVVGSSLTPREMKLPSAGLLLPAAAQVAAPKVHSRVCHFGKATASSRSIPKKDQPPEHHRKLVADAIGKRFGQGAF